MIGYRCMPYRSLIIRTLNVTHRKMCKIEKTGGGLGTRLAIQCIFFQIALARALNQPDNIDLFVSVCYINTVKPLITDSPKGGQPLYSGQISCPRLLFL